MSRLKPSPPAHCSRAATRQQAKGGKGQRLSAKFLSLDVAPAARFRSIDRYLSLSHYTSRLEPSQVDSDFFYRPHSVAHENKEFRFSLIGLKLFERFLSSTPRCSHLGASNLK